MNTFDLFCHNSCSRKQQKKCRFWNTWGGKERMSWWTLAVPTGGFVSALKWLSGQSSTDIMLEPLQLFPSRMAHRKGSAQSTWATLKLYPQATSPVPVMTKLTGWDILFFVHYQFLTAYVIASYLKCISFVVRFCMFFSEPLSTSTKPTSDILSTG